MVLGVVSAVLFGIAGVMRVMAKLYPDAMVAFGLCALAIAIAL